MKVKDLLEERDSGIFKSPILEGDLIALDGKSGKVLFDTTRNKKEYIKMFYEGEVLNIWSDVRLINGVGFGDYFKPVTKIYISHRSWLSEE